LPAKDETYLINREGIVSYLVAVRKSEGFNVGYAGGTWTTDETGDVARYQPYYDASSMVLKTNKNLFHAVLIFNYSGELPYNKDAE